MKKEGKGNVLMWVLLVILPPIGIIYMWIVKKNFTTKKKGALTVVFLIWFAIVMIFGGSGSDQDDSNVNSVNPQQEDQQAPADQTDDPADYSTVINSLESQNRAVFDLIQTYENGEDGKSNSADRLHGIAGGIDNTIDMIRLEGDTEQGDALEAYATALRGVAEHYANYLDNGSESELEDSNNLRDRLDDLWAEAEKYQQ